MKTPNQETGESTPLIGENMKVLIQKIGENTPCFEGEVFSWEFDPKNFTIAVKDGAEPQTFSRDEYGGKGIA